MADTRNNILIRIGRRPFRWFICVWLGLTVLWLLSGFMGYKWERHPIGPPVPEAVPYADYLPGGKWYNPKAQLDLDQSEIPVFNPAIVRPEYHYMIWGNVPGRDSVVLDGWQKSSQGQFGWRKRWLSWSRTNHFDVSNPGLPFERLSIPGQSDRTEWYFDRLSIARYIENQSAVRYLYVEWAWFIRTLFLIQVIAGLAIWIPAKTFHVMIRRRLRQNFCWSCGYDLRGADALPCSECGTNRHATYNDWLTAFCGSTRFLAGRYFRWCFLMLVVLWIVMQVIGSPPLETLTPENRLAKMQTRFKEQGDLNYGRIMGWISPIKRRLLGWPVTLVLSQANRRFEFRSGEDPVPGIYENQEPDYVDSDVIYQNLESQDPTVNRWYLFYWRALLTELAGVQMLALWMTGSIAVILSYRRKEMRREP